jgi:hypothetical protein
MDHQRPAQYVFDSNAQLTLSQIRANEACAKAAQARHRRRRARPKRSSQRRRGMKHWAIKRRSSSEAIPTSPMIFSTTRLALCAEGHFDNSESQHRMRS